MSLSPASDREDLHTRTITVKGYKRADGLYDIEGHLTDIKTYGFPNHDRGEIKAGEPIHEMWVRMVVDQDMKVHQVEAATEYGPFRLCGLVDGDFAGLAGLTIGPGFLKAVRQRFAGIKGCTHLVELFGPLATTAYQTLAGVRHAKANAEKASKKPPLIESCRAFAADDEVVKRLWPDYFTGTDQTEV